ncbi:MAG: site-specific integrase [Actinomycetota bacterium]|nr:site-specific integrase [Actinomycetota bacterium]
MESTRPDERPLGEGRGRVVVAGDASLPFRLLDDCDQPIAAVDDFVRELHANGNSPSTCRSYTYDLLDWFRFLRAAETSWDRATRQDVRDYVLSVLALTTPNAGDVGRTHHRRAA